MSVALIHTEAPIMKWSLGVKEADGYLHRRDLAPGTGNIRTLADGSIIFTYVCPCGCGAVTFVGIEKDGDVRAASWRWDGNTESPTLSPSLQQHSACRWHGFMQAGQFINA